MAGISSLALPEPELVNQVIGLVEAFGAFDSDSDGFITNPELAGILNSLGYKASQQEVDAMMRKWDKDLDGQLSLPEFLEMNFITMELPADFVTSLRTAFDSFGFVTPDDLFDMLPGDA